MNRSLPLFQRMKRNLLWYVEDVVTAITGRARPFHFVYGRDSDPRVNPATARPMTDRGVDVTGLPYSAGHGPR
jgi:hypothetical protein